MSINVEPITYHFNLADARGYRDLMSSETYKDISNETRHRTVARVYSKRIVDVLIKALTDKGVYVP